MDKRWTRWVAMAAAVLICRLAALGDEHLDRGLVALPREDGSVFLSWRLLAEDAESTAFAVTRRDAGAPDNEGILLTGRHYRSTNFDAAPPNNTGRKEHVYELCLDPAGAGEPQKTAQVKVALTGKATPYVSIPLDGNYDFQKWP